MKYVSPEYQAQLDHLAETLVTPERFGTARDIGQLVLLFESDMGNTTVQAHLVEGPPDDAA